MFVVDTNVLVYAAIKESPDHEACRRFIETCRGDRIPWFLTWSLVYEFLRVTTHPRVFRKPLSIGRAWQFVEAVLASPSLSMLVATERHSAIAGALLKETPGLRGNLLHDVHTVALMLEHGVGRIYTRDVDFHRFPMLSVIDPARGA